MLVYTKICTLFCAGARSCELPARSRSDHLSALPAPDDDNHVAVLERIEPKRRAARAASIRPWAALTTIFAPGRDSWEDRIPGQVPRSRMTLLIGSRVIP